MQNVYNSLWNCSLSLVCTCKLLLKVLPVFELYTAYMLKLISVSLQKINFGCKYFQNELNKVSAVACQAKTLLCLWLNCHRLSSAWLESSISEKVPGILRYTTPNSFRSAHICLNWFKKKTLMCLDRSWNPPNRHFFKVSIPKAALLLRVGGAQPAGWGKWWMCRVDF